jgi:hypothetical protein
MASVNNYETLTKVPVIKSFIPYCLRDASTSLTLNNFTLGPHRMCLVFIDIYMSKRNYIIV